MLGTLPAVLLVGALVWQLALAGHSLWLCSHAARAAARAAVVGEDPTAAARSAVPAGLREEIRVERSTAGRVEVRMPMPLLRHRWRTPVTIDATSSLGPAP